MTPTTGAPWLVADIGGTNARFGLVTDDTGTPREVRVLPCAAYDGLAAATEAYLADTGARPSEGCVAAAGPVHGDRFRLTNAPWEFSVTETGARLGLRRFELINDFAALALAAPLLPPASVLPIGGLRHDNDLPLAVIGPGTGLGVSALVPSRSGWTPVCGEGGHVTLPYETRLEIEIAALLRDEFPQLTAETVLSGPGLVRLHRALSTVTGQRAEPHTPERIAAAEDDLSRCTVETFCGLLGAFARNVALTTGARGGVLLGGGILPRIPGILATSTFRERFIGTGTMSDYLREISTELITSSVPALRGAAAWLATQHEGASEAA